MDAIYITIAERLKEAVPELKWIDMDNGQLDYDEYRAAVDFPAALIAVEYLQCDDIGLTGGQKCTVQLSILLVTKIFDGTNFDAPQEVRQRAMEAFVLMNTVQESLQSWQPENKSLAKLSRINAYKEKRNDGLMVISINYKTNYIDMRHYEKQLIETSVVPFVNKL